MSVQTEQRTTAAIRAYASSPLVLRMLPFILFLIGYALAPRWADDQTISTLIYIGISALLAIGLNLLMGYAGQISLGHAAFFGIGAYASAILAVRPVQTELIPGIAMGVGLMAGWVTLASLTKVNGLKLALGVALMLVSAWAARLTGTGLVGLLLASLISQVVFGLITGLGWKKCSIAGAVFALSVTICNSFLVGVLKNNGTSPWFGIVAGIVVTSLIAYLIGSQVLRLKGHYLAMATLGFGMIVEIVFKQWTAITGGSSDGIFGIPTIKLAEPVQRLLSLLVGTEATVRQQYYYLVWGFVFLALVLAVNIVQSRVGRAFRAVHGSEVAAESLGVDTGRYKVQVFVLSAALASLAGSLHAHNAGIGYINPAEFSFIVSVQLVAMVVIGGMASVWGALMGAVTIQLLKDWMLELSKTDTQVLGITLKGIDPIVFGGILIVVMIVMPQGLVRGLTDLAAAFWRTTMAARKKNAA